MIKLFQILNGDLIELDSGSVQYHERFISFFSKNEFYVIRTEDIDSKKLFYMRNKFGFDEGYKIFESRICENIEIVSIISNENEHFVQKSVLNHNFHKNIAEVDKQKYRKFDINNILTSDSYYFDDIGYVFHSINGIKVKCQCHDSIDAFLDERDVIRILGS